MICCIFIYVSYSSVALLSPRAVDKPLLSLTCSLFSSFAQSCTCDSEEVTALCPVRNAMWMGNNKGLLTIKVFHAPSGTLQSLFSGKLMFPSIKREQSSLDYQRASILAMCHIKETSSMFVSVQSGNSGEIWVVRDHVVSGNLTVQKRFHQPLVRSLIKISTKDLVTIWGTMDTNRLLRFETKLSASARWSKEEVSVDSEFHQCSLLAQTSYMTLDKSAERTHVWVANNGRALLAAIDVQTKTKHCKINYSKEFRVGKYSDFFACLYVQHETHI